MGVMKENFVRHAHDLTFAPTGLWNFVQGNELVDSSGNGKNLTQDDAPTDSDMFVTGEAEGLTHFGFYRNNSSEFQYTGAMSLCCLVRSTDWVPNSSNNYVQLAMCDYLTGAPDARFSLQITPTGIMRYAHQTSGVLHTVTADQLYRDREAWQHLAFTRDAAGTAVKLYVNGVMVKSGTTGAAAGTTGTAYLSLGEMHGSSSALNSNYTQTSIAIFDKELSADEIKYLARKTLGYSEVSG
jgi:hypothetical protein